MELRAHLYFALAEKIRESIDPEFCCRGEASAVYQGVHPVPPAHLPVPGQEVRQSTGHRHPQGPAGGQRCQTQGPG